MKPQTRKCIALAAATAGLVAAAGLKNTFGTGKATPALKHELVMRSAQDLGYSFGFEHGLANLPTNDVYAFARSRSDPSNHVGPDGDSWREAFVRGYQSGAQARASELARLQNAAPTSSPQPRSRDRP